MKITIESTDRIVVVNGAPCRLWQGRTDRGIRIAALVARVGAAEEDGAAFQVEATQHPPVAADPETLEICPYAAMFVGTVVPLQAANETGEH